MCRCPTAYLFPLFFTFYIPLILTSSAPSSLGDVARQSSRRLYGDNAMGPVSGRLRIEMPVVPPFVKILRKEYRRWTTESPLLHMEGTMFDGGFDSNGITTTLATLMEGYGDLELGFEYPKGEEFQEYDDYYGVMEWTNQTTPLPSFTPDNAVPPSQSSILTADPVSHDALTVNQSEIHTVGTENIPSTLQGKVEDIPSNQTTPMNIANASLAEAKTENVTNESENKEIILNDNRASSVESHLNDTTTPIPRLPKLLFENDHTATDADAVQDTVAITSFTTPSSKLPEISLPTPSLMDAAIGSKKILPAQGNKGRVGENRTKEGPTRKKPPGNGGGLFQSILNMAHEKTKLINSTFTQLASVLMGFTGRDQKSIEARRQHFS